MRTLLSLRIALSVCFPFQDLESGCLESAFGAGVYVALLPAASTSPYFMSAFRAGELDSTLFDKADPA